jgi:hypothetical protein
MVTQAMSKDATGRPARRPFLPTVPAPKRRMEAHPHACTGRASRNPVALCIQSASLSKKAWDFMKVK